jgi:site-specific DNA-methyltransferase (adenine-specific)
MEKVWLETKRVLVPGGRFALNIAPTSIKNFRPIHHDFANQLRQMGMIMRTEIVWYKQTMGRRTAWGSWKSPSNPHIVPSWEYILVFCKDSWVLSGKPTDTDITPDEFMRFSDGFWYIPPESQRRGHPTPFPEELIYRLIKFYSYKGNIVLDMFGGTGTVAIVAYKTGRHFIHIDISPKYCKVAEERLATARMLKELPLSIGRTGKTIKVIRARPSELESARIRPLKEKAEQPSLVADKSPEYKRKGNENA